MKSTTQKYSLLLLCIIVFIHCHKNNTVALTPEADTRLWVESAYKKINLMELTSTFNTERAALIKQRLDVEQDANKRVNLTFEYALELIKCGQTQLAIETIDNVTKFLTDNKVPIEGQTRRDLYAIIGIAYMRHGEIENCIQAHNHESCFIPIQNKGIHQLTYGSRKAIETFEQCLSEFPEDLETKYLLNICYQTLGEYPHKVPKQWLIDPSWFSSTIPFPRFEDVAAKTGVNRNGLAGGTVVDDFNNDGWLDIVVTSWGPHTELILYINNGDGTFSDQTEAYNLKGHVGILNLNQTDFNNDGWLDLFLMRGAWYHRNGDLPCTLLQNTGNGSFVDVTLHAGLTKYAPSQTSAWADYNLDGWLDVVKANESLHDFERSVDVYINQHDGTFKHASEDYGLTSSLFYKGCVATDLNNDRYPDMYFSALSAPNYIAINQGAKDQNKFVLADSFTNVGEPNQSFPCWAFDYDNDGLEDIFVSSYANDGTPAEHWMKSHLGTADPVMLPKLYHNKGNLKFEEVGVQMGLNEVAFTMGCNFGDINTDGYLDFYLATGNPLFQALVPNKMYLNVEGNKFEDVSYNGGFANIQKGHGVGFGDLDRDGDEDVYVVIGGAFDGDAFFNSLFENPNHEKNNWVFLKLEGTEANKAAIGARVTISVQENGAERKIYRTVNSGASFGGNSLALEVGLRKASVINSVHVQWPCKSCPDETFKGLGINKAYKLTQGSINPVELPYQYVPFGSVEVDAHHHHDMNPATK
jgi:hypothetical protein